MIKPIPTSVEEGSRNKSRGITKTRKAADRFTSSSLKVNISSSKASRGQKANKLSERLVEKLGIK